MDLIDPFDKLVILRKRINAKELHEEFGESLDPLRKIVTELETTGGIEVRPEDIQRIGPYLSYKGEVLAILYIFNSNNSKSELETDSPAKRAPKFHFTWCRTLDDMTRKKRFDRYILSRSKENLFKVEACERHDHEIALYGERHVMDGIRLYPCQNCLDELSYKSFSYKNLNKKQRLDIVEKFTIKEYLDENDGTFNVMKYTPKYTDKNAPSGNYTKDFPKISTELRENANWHCSKCDVDMNMKKNGLHVHHINGVKSDNSHSNLKVLCALCHKNIDQFHKGMYVSSDIEQFILTHRP